MQSKHNNKKYLIWFWSLFFFPFALIALLFILISKEKLGPMPSFTQLENPEYFLATEVFSDDGTLLGKISMENLTWTEYENLSPHLVDALIATEDIRYFRHSGIDIRGLGRVVVRTILMGPEIRRREYNTAAACKTTISEDTARMSSLTRKLKAWII
jgi:penicillin-binding protein 1A